MLIAHTYIERQTHQTALERERYTYTHQQTAAETLRAQVLWCVLRWPLILASVTLEGSAVSTSPATHHDTAVMQYLAQHTHTHTRCMLMIRQITSHFCLTNTHEYKLLNWKFGRTGIINEY